MLARVVLLASLIAAPASAEPRLAAMTFERAIGLTEALPTIAATRAAAEAERTAEMPRPWQPLQLRLTPMRRLAPDEDRGQEGQISVEQALPLTDLREQRRAVQAATSAQRTAAATAAALDARIDTAAAWIAGWNAREQLVAATRDRELARSLVTLSERAQAAGTLTAPELADARAFLAEAELRFLDAQGALAEAGFATARSLGLTTAIASEGELPTPALPDEARWPTLIANVSRSPHAVARQVAARAERGRAAEERALRGAQLLLGGSIGRDGPQALVAGVTVGISLPHDRGQREALLAETNARIADAEAMLLLARATTELAAALHDVEHTTRAVAEIDERLVPVTADAAARRQRAFDVGEATILELLAARRTANAAIARSREAHAARAWARVRAYLLVEATR